MRAIKAILKKRFQNLLRDDIIVVLIKGSSVSLFFRIIGIIMTYLFTFLIAKWYGPKGVGIFSISYIVIQIASLLSKSGSDTAMLKFSADLSTKQEWETLRKTLAKAYMLVIPIGLLLCWFAYEHSALLATLFNKKDLAGYIAIAALGFVPISLLYINAEFLRGLKNIAFYSILQSTLPFGLAALIIIYFHLSGHRESEYVILSFVYSLLISFLVSLFLVRKATISKINWTGIRHRIGGDTVSWKFFISVSLSLMIVSTISYMMGWIDTVILGIYKSEDQVGIYNVCIRIATATMIPLLAVNSIAGPHFASAWVTKDITTLKQVAHKSTNMIFYFSLPILLIIMIFPVFVLGLFGGRFATAPIPLMIISFAQFINAICGSVGLLLQMTEKYNQFQVIVFISLIANIVFSLWLIPKFGIAGAAIGTSSAIILSNVLSVLYVKKCFGFWMINIKVFQVIKKIGLKASR